MPRVKKEKKTSMARDPSKNPWIVFYKQFYAENKEKYKQVTEACKQASVAYKKLTPEEKVALTVS